jgi:Cell wall-active antibiotics response 4TMS YvqF
MRPFRAAALVLLGGFAGLMAAAAVLKQALPSRGDEESDEVALVAIFDGIDLKSRARAFRGGTMLAWYGGIAVDLREATLADDARLSVHSLFGGVAIRVPPDWRVESRARAIAGGVDVKMPASGDSDAPTLTIEGRALFGGIAVGARVADAAFVA